jgi:hypothetical protein
MNDDHQHALDEISGDIDRATHPDNMSQEEALEFLEELQSNIEASIAGLKDDMQS